MEEKQPNPVDTPVKFFQTPAFRWECPDCGEPGVSVNVHHVKRVKEGGGIVGDCAKCETTLRLTQNRILKPQKPRIIASARRLARG